MANQHGYPENRIEEQTAYLLKGFYDSRERLKSYSYSPGVLESSAAAAGAVGGMAYANDLGLLTLGLAGFAAVTAGGSVYLQNYLNAPSRQQLESKTKLDVKLTADYIRGDRGDDPFDGDGEPSPVETPPGTNTYNRGRPAIV